MAGTRLHGNTQGECGREEGGLRIEPRGWRNEEERSREDGEGAATREEKD